LALMIAGNVRTEVHLFKSRRKIARDKIRDGNSLCACVLCLVKLLWACEALGLWSSFSL
jgi:hypothetical protein